MDYRHRFESLPVRLSLLWLSYNGEEEIQSMIVIVTVTGIVKMAMATMAVVRDCCYFQRSNGMLRATTMTIHSFESEERENLVIRCLFLVYEFHSPSFIIIIFVVVFI